MTPTGDLRRKPRLPKQNDKNDMMKVCMQETASVILLLHNVAAAQLSPASRPRARPTPGRKCVCACGMQQTDR